jgi:uncharacterized RDD family membrane protein YckC
MMTPPLQPAGSLRRLGAIIYDSLIAFSILFFTMGVLLLANRGQAFAGYQWCVTLCFAIVLGSYFVWGWRKQGSLGMQAWRLKLVNKYGERLTRKQAWIRYVFGIFSCYTLGLPLVWCLLDPEQQGLHDRICGTKMLLVPKA